VSKLLINNSLANLLKKSKNVQPSRHTGIWRLYRSLLCRDDKLNKHQLRIKISSLSKNLSLS